MLLHNEYFQEADAYNCPFCALFGISNQLISPLSCFCKFNINPKHILFPPVFDMLSGCSPLAGSLFILSKDLTIGLLRK